MRTQTNTTDILLPAVALESIAATSKSTNIQICLPLTQWMWFCSLQMGRLLERAIFCQVHEVGQFTDFPTSAGKMLMKTTSKRARGCKECISCKREDCGSCRYCKDMTKFGGQGKKKQKCIHRVCTGINKGIMT